MENISTYAKLGNQVFDNAMMNAAGVYCETEDELNDVLASSAGGVITKSATPSFRAGNPSPRQELLKLGSINSMGLPNQGLDYYLNFALKHHNKPIIISVAGTSVEQNIEMLTQIEDSDFDGLVELNLSCPNVVGKPQVGYDFEALEQVLTKVFSFYDKQLGIKLPPYFDFAQFDEVAGILNKFPLTYINCINSVGNGLVIDPEKESVVIKPKDGFGGVGGDYVKPTALANVHAFRKRLNSSIQIIGTGGITNGVDIFEHILAGADLVQIGTELLREGPEVFTRLTKELKDCMSEKGYESLTDFRNQLKEI